MPSDTDRIQRLRHTLLFRREPELAMAGPVWQARMPVTEKTPLGRGVCQRVDMAPVLTFDVKPGVFL